MALSEALSGRGETTHESVRGFGTKFRRLHKKPHPALLLRILMNDDTARWHVTEAIFHDALLVAEPARTALLTAQCAGDTTLMAELQSLLAACEAEEDHRSRVGMESVSSGTSIGPYVID